jgi:hypothetical protein
LAKPTIELSLNGFLVHSAGEVRSAEERLRFCAEQFDTVEVDSTYYALPAKSPTTPALYATASKPRENRPAPSGSQLAISEGNMYLNWKGMIDHIAAVVLIMLIRLCVAFDIFGTGQQRVLSRHLRCKPLEFPASAGVPLNRV